MTECLKIYAFYKDKNPKWRGGLPKCKTCGKDTSWYKSRNKRNPQNYCKPCFNKRLAIISKQLGKERKGIYPKALMSFAFRKGMRPQNKLYEEYTQCIATGCIRKPIAQMLCGLHYQRNKGR